MTAVSVMACFHLVPFDKQIQGKCSNETDEIITTDQSRAYLLILII